MKVRFAREPAGLASPTRRGFASVIALILIFVMIALLLGNNQVLSSLKRELQQIEQRQSLRANRSDEPTTGNKAVPVSVAREAGGEDNRRGSVPAPVAKASAP